jgi:YD repeat-containing protein
VLDGKTDMETTYEFDPAGRVTVQAHPNGATSYFDYDLAGRLLGGPGCLPVTYEWAREDTHQTPSAATYSCFHYDESGKPEEMTTGKGSDCSGLLGFSYSRNPPAPGPPLRAGTTGPLVYHRYDTYPAAPAIAMPLAIGRGMRKGRNRARRDVSSRTPSGR